ncbi:hypothetical protein MBLNU459_g0462t1 [Dothideomycetes sp. NU459]
MSKSTRLSRIRSLDVAAGSPPEDGELDTSPIDAAPRANEAFRASLRQYSYASDATRSVPSSVSQQSQGNIDALPGSGSDHSAGGFSRIPGRSTVKRGRPNAHGLSEPSEPSPLSAYACPPPSRAAKKIRTAATGRDKSSRYAPPAKYAHLPPLTDLLAPALICVFVGTNPGIRTSTAGHAYAHPSNSFWKLLHSSGCTSRRLRPDEDGTLPADWSMGNTNIVERPTKDAAELSKAEMCEGAEVLQRKMARYRPEAVCIVGKGIWEAIWRAKYGKNPTKDEFRWGWQDEKENMGTIRVGGGGGGAADGDDDDNDNDGDDGLEDEHANSDEKHWKGAKVYVTTSTSGLSASLKPAEKEAIWRPFGEWVKERRAQRAEAAAAAAATAVATAVVPKVVQHTAEL